ncbi:hypothetical protein [Oceanobacillus sp. J11TS1]|uniref:hypothetical protein n=1 Tax=Oceanobacillus sp. J11TS1 TaxID=2807191 RepID=UPI001B055C73|nr:hypothetical protein [Oceanobacillus sp. J11TS1]GIO22246.1 hypothetical protein J11TS1_08270 [Oceanobacillus sp. J11TS1]
MKVNCICKFLNDISVYSVQHLGWVTAIVAAILALTSIVFSQFNERSIQKANDIARDIKIRINKDEKLIESYMVKEDFNQMVYLLTNSAIYKKTLFLFQGLSYFIVFLWWLSLFGYISDAKTFADKVLIFLSTILISIPFLYLPDIMKLFNKNQPLKFDSKDQLDIKEVVSFFKENTPLKESIIISDFLSPRIKVELEHRNILVHHIIDIDVVNFTTVFRIQGEEKRVTLNISKDTSDTKKMFSVRPLEDEGATYDNGLFTLFKSLVGSDVVVFFCISETEYTSYKGKIKFNEGKIEISILNSSNKTLSASNYSNKNQLVVEPNLGESKIYKLLDRLQEK